MGTRAVGKTVWLGILLLAMAVDGVDMAALATTIPAISDDWDVSPSRFTGALVATSVGAVIGYLASDPMVSRWGAHAVVWRSVVFVALITPVTAMVGSVPQLGAVRLIVGLGLGAALPAAVSLAGDLYPLRRESAAMVVVLGLVVGNLVAGLTAGSVIAMLGWRAVFVGTASCALLVGVLIGLLRVPALVAKTPVAQHSMSMRALVGRDIWLATTLLWAAAFVASACYQLLQAWLPTLAVAIGMPREKAPLALAVMGTGGLLGGAAVAACRTRITLARRLTGLLAGGSAALGASAVVEHVPVVTAIAVAVTGAGLVAAGAGVAALAVALYPVADRITGVSGAATATRIGAIAGPAVGGTMVTHTAPTVILASLVIPVLAVAILLAALAVRVSRVPQRSDGLHGVRAQ